MRRKAILCILLGLLCMLCSGCNTASDHDGRSGSAAHASPSARSLGLILDEQESGVTILAVRSGSAAEQGGLQPGDVLKTANGNAISRVRDLNDSIRAAQELTLTVERNEELLEFCLPLSEDET